MTPSELVSHLAPYDRARLALIFEYLGVKPTLSPSKTGSLE